MIETDLVQVVFLAELDRLLPSVVPPEEACRNATELDKGMLLQMIGQSDVVEVVVGIDRSFKSNMIFLFDK